ncbi:MAG: dienelactone hydrolase family protein [Muribaculaceae bacterium]|nr:dienelactone hydrolase family protein [Muribaculaceae bacterium]
MTINAQLKKGTTTPKYNVVPDSYNFLIHTPADYAPNDHKSPLVIFLHGRSLCGRNLNMVKKYGVIDAIERGKIVPAIVLAPQNPGGAWNARKINDLINWTAKHYAVDTTRIYVLGMSLGGYGTMDFVAAYPHRVAAAMALCGGCYAKNMDGLGEAPLWIMHGTADRAVPISESKRVVNYLKQKGKTNLLRYDWISGGSHGLLARLFYLQQTYDWLFCHDLRQKPREVDRNFNITQQDLKDVYSELKWFKDMFEYD